LRAHGHEPNFPAMPPDSSPPAALLAARTAPTPRRYGAVNWLGLWTLLMREVRRFLKVFTQTIAAPVVTTLLLLAVFALALGGAVRQIAGVSFAEFLAPGLIIMAMVQNAFANTSSSIVISKVQGNIVDSLMPPLSAAELTLGFALGGVARGVAVGVTVALCLTPIVTLHVHSVFFIVFHGIAGSLLLSSLGVAGGIWSQKFDHIAAVTNFVVTPLTFLSGTFYTVDRLPEPWHMLALWNPFFYMIDGFRYGFLGRHDGDLTLGIIMMTVVNAALLWLCHWMFRTGYKLRP
jgi:ABC-2 type transport system permease protein